MTDLLSASKSNKDSTALDPPATIKEEQASTSIVAEASSDTKEAKEPTFQITFSPQEDTKEDEEFSEQHPLVTDLIIIDHHEARSLYEDYKACYNKEEKQKLRNRIVRVLVIHDECEQMVVYLSLKDRIPGDVGKQTYERSLSEHQYLRDLL
ncbi:uncharacterized protein B0P05DRAFT_548246 [Gilbertella persicaria]|uniref:uncharacterized protein n=1 Tax=Gilbertella persicaria TaxID=101096 RepID=UPI00221F5EE3|nr:uncharacterized protein B0P05DRAFT_548246 [Gilbertella persicaria]KAI8074360.1 hypothetical protein B0P05DRAFT_548246 [Gilbertella persicaria]